ncbi:MAG TPA: endonuclease VII domain-containing protein [Jatrophihabitans sp.]|nr:endonuclease VII domain-containing protein [Jatrophihabitans sp.]
MILNGESEDRKFCPDCRRDLSVSKFTRNARSRDGLAFYCAECARVRLTESKRRRHGPPRTRSGQGPRDVPDGLKWCPECGEVKPLDDFPRNRSQRRGRGSYCKPCHNKIVRANKELHGGSRNYHLRRRYGIAAEHFDTMFAEQGGRCAICREAPAEQVDHDHATNRVRGLLCFNCNGALGQFRDRADLMLRAIAYLGHDGTTPLVDLPTFHFGVHVGAVFDRPREGEPDAA